MKIKNSKKSTFLKILGLFLILTVITGVLYPLVVTGISQVAFQGKANGSIIEVDGKKYGSILLAQEFTGEEYMWGRVMNIDIETFEDGDGKELFYAVPSNISPASETYQKLIKERIEKLEKSNPAHAGESIPVDLVTCSGSGLDPHISPAAAKYQIERIAGERKIKKEKIENIIETCTDGKLFGILGEKTVNVLEVNLMLDGIL